MIEKIFSELDRDPLHLFQIGTKLRNQDASSISLGRFIAARYLNEFGEIGFHHAEERAVLRSRFQADLQNMSILQIGCHDKLSRPFGTVHHVDSLMHLNPVSSCTYGAYEPVGLNRDYDLIIAQSLAKQVPNYDVYSDIQSLPDYHETALGLHMMLDIFLTGSKIHYENSKNDELENIFSIFRSNITDREEKDPYGNVAQIFRTLNEGFSDTGISLTWMRGFRDLERHDYSNEFLRNKLKKGGVIFDIGPNSTRKLDSEFQLLHNHYTRQSNLSIAIRME